MQKIIDIKKPLLRDLEKATKAILQQKGVKPNSELYNNIDWIESEDNKVMTLIALDYFQWVDTGRRSGIMPPVEDLIPWIKKNGIMPSNGMSINQLAFAIANAIKRDGIMGKNYSNSIVETTTDILSEELAEMMADTISTAIVQAIENKNF